MPFLGYGSMGGVEVWNNERTKEYARRYLPRLTVRCDCDCAELHTALDEPPYRTPMHDLPDWYDPAEPRSGDYYGMLALGWTGMADTTLETVLTETLGDGGVVGLSRHRMKEVRVTALVMAGSADGLDYGLSWLRKAMSGNPCGDGDRFCFFSTCPSVCADSPNWPTWESGPPVLVEQPLEPPEEVAGPVLPSPGFSGEGVLTAEPPDWDDNQEWENDDTWVGNPSDPGVPDPPPDDIPPGYSYRSLDGHDRCVLPNLRSLEHVSVDGPRVLQTYGLHEGAMVRVEFVITAARPFIYGEPVTIADVGFTEPATEVDRNLLHDPVSRYTTLTNENTFATAVADSSTGRTATMSTLDTAAATVLDLVATNPTPIPASVGQTWHAITHLQGVAGRSGQVLVQFRSATGVVIGEQAGPAVPMTGGYVQVRASVVAPPGTRAVSLRGVVATRVGVAPVGEQAWMTDSLLTQARMAPHYFYSGDTLETIDQNYLHRWEDVAYASASIRSFIDHAINIWHPGAQVLTQERPLDCFPLEVPGLVEDPDCPPLLQPPRPPLVEVACIDDAGYATSRAILVPGGVLPEWSDAVPVLTLSSDQDVRQARVRFYPAPIEQPLDELDPCGYCGEFIVSYLPARARLEFNGLTETITIQRGAPGEFDGEPAWNNDEPWQDDVAWPQSGTIDQSVIGEEEPMHANHLVYGSGGGVFTWPLLSCGTAYWVTIDTTATGGSVNQFHLAIATRE